MGCCISHFDKETIYEVTLDSHGVAQRVSKGHGTHFIHVSPNKETYLREKTENDFTADTKWPAFPTPVMYSSRRIHPVMTTKEPEIKEEKPLI